MITDEIMANQMSVALTGELLKELYTLPDPVKLYIIDLAYKYYCRRFNIEYQFENTSFQPLSTNPARNPETALLQEYRTSEDLRNNESLPLLQREFTDANFARPATEQLYGTSINYEKQLPINNAVMEGPTGMPYPTLYDGRPDNFEFSGADGFESGEAADPAEY